MAARTSGILINLGVVDKGPQGVPTIHTQVLTGYPDRFGTGQIAHGVGHIDCFAWLGQCLTGKKRLQHRRMFERPLSGRRPGQSGPDGVDPNAESLRARPPPPACNWSTAAFPASRRVRRRGIGPKR